MTSALSMVISVDMYDAVVVLVDGWSYEIILVRGDDVGCKWVTEVCDLWDQVGLCMQFVSTGLFGDLFQGAVLEHSLVGCLLMIYMLARFSFVAVFAGAFNAMTTVVSSLRFVIVVVWCLELVQLISEGFVCGRQVLVHGLFKCYEGMLTLGFVLVMVLDFGQCPLWNAYNFNVHLESVSIAGGSVWDGSALTGIIGLTSYIYIYRSAG
eukprot:gene2537-1592_t